jgi:hypothetical protein
MNPARGHGRVGVGFDLLCLTCEWPLSSDGARSAISKTGSRPAVSGGSAIDDQADHDWPLKAEHFGLGRSSKKMISPKERQELIAYLERCAREGKSADLPIALVGELLAVLGVPVPAPKSQVVTPDEALAFRVDAWSLDGSFEEHLGSSLNEDVARTLYAEAMKHSPDRKITLTRGADVLE